MLGLAPLSSRCSSRLLFFSLMARAMGVSCRPIGSSLRVFRDFWFSIKWFALEISSFNIAIESSVLFLVFGDLR